MSSAFRAIERSEYARFGRYLNERHFMLVMLIALLVHLIGFVIYYLVPETKVEEIPVRILSVKLGGKVDNAVDSAELQRIYDKRNNTAFNIQTDSQLKAESITAPSGNRLQKAKQQKAKPQADKRNDVSASKNEAVVKPNVVKIPQAFRDKISLPDTSPRRYIREDSLRQEGGSEFGNSTSSSAAIQSRYTQDISLWLDKHKVYPVQAKARGEGGKVVLRIRINRQGKILRYMLEQSSGSAEIDQAISQMVDAANPLPTVPADYPDAKPYLEFLVPISFVP